MSENLLVSVCMIAYNHREFISQAIEGVLLQKTNFSFELVIGEDKSPDGTLEICLEYQRLHPKIVRILDRDKNLGMQRNFMETLKACEGKYVAICEGDDYWTDPNKLQKQVDFMQSHPEFSISHHRLKIIENDISISPYITPSSPAETTFEDLARRQHIATASCLFRNKLFEFPDVFLKVHGTDYFLNLLNANHGKIGFIDEVMGVYRVHGQGEWSSRTAEDRAAIALDTITICGSYFHPRAAAEFEYQRLKNDCFLQFELSNFREFRKRFREARTVSRRFLTKSDLAALWVRFFLSFTPFLNGAFSFLRTRRKRI